MAATSALASQTRECLPVQPWQIAHSISFCPHGFSMHRHPLYDERALGTTWPPTGDICLRKGLYLGNVMPPTLKFPHPAACFLAAIVLCHFSS